MAYELILKPLAELDIAEAAEWYLNRGKTLAGAFLNTVDAAMETISKFPELYQKRYWEVRVVFTPTFPYGIYYTLEKKRVVVHAVLHTRRDAKNAVTRL